MKLTSEKLLVLEFLFSFIAIVMAICGNLCLSSIIMGFSCACFVTLILLEESRKN